ALNNRWDCRSRGFQRARSTKAGDWIARTLSLQFKTTKKTRCKHTLNRRLSPCCLRFGSQFLWRVDLLLNVLVFLVLEIKLTSMPLISCSKKSGPCSQSNAQVRNLLSGAPSQTIASLVLVWNCFPTLQNLEIFIMKWTSCSARCELAQVSRLKPSK